MPCENCSAQFSVFKRKKACSECRRLYCSSCLQKKKELVLCGRCRIFTARPLSKIDLLKLKPKDLIFYLQSKHISTAGCVEKEELVNLILAHSRTTSPTSTTSSHRGSTATSTNNIFDENCANPFITIRQTCTTFFTNISDRIAADLQKASAAAAAYETQKQGSSGQAAPPPRRASGTSATSNNNNNNVHRSNSTTSSASSFASVNSKVPKPPPASNPNTTSSSSSSATTSPRQQPAAAVHKPNIPDARLKNLLAANNGCECGSDDEATAPGPSHAVAGTSQVNIPKSDSSTTSSFEELGTSTGVNSSVGGQRTTNDSDSWQLINQTNSSNNSLDLNAPTSSSSQTSSGLMNGPAPARAEQGENAQPTAAACDTNSKPSIKKINRRRSDSSVVLKNGSRANLNDSDEDEDDDVDNTGGPEADLARKRRKCAVGAKTSCEKCGKRKNGIKRSLARFRRQLEESGCSDAEKQRKLDEFLKELEERTKNSLDFSDSDGEKSGETTGGTSQAAVMAEDEDDMVYLTDENEGINVYGSEAEEPKPRRFLQLDDIKASADLETLSVKQLKEILVLNRVDFKGCCEKKELLERVKRLWNDHASLPSIEKLLPDDICKICMDAPIECVLLECGHMACCTNCGKVLSECPICRQYIVRVVRFFRA